MATQTPLRTQSRRSADVACTNMRPDAEKPTARRSADGRSMTTHPLARRSFMMSLPGGCRTTISSGQSGACTATLQPSRVDLSKPPPHRPATGTRRPSSGPIPGASRASSSNQSPVSSSRSRAMSSPLDASKTPRPLHETAMTSSVVTLCSAMPTQTRPPTAASAVSCHGGGGGAVAIARSRRRSSSRYWVTSMGPPTVRRAVRRARRRSDRAHCECPLPYPSPEPVPGPRGIRTRFRWSSG